MALAGIPGASATSQRLLGFWFEDEHRSEDGLLFRFYFCQRESVETLIYLNEIERHRSRSETRHFAAQGLLVQPGEAKRQRLAFKMATGRAR